MKRNNKIYFIQFAVIFSVIAILFGALFLLGNPGGFDKYADRLLKKAGFIKQTQTAENGEVSVGGTLTLHFIDVGQADCTLIECGGHFMLVDGGNNDDAQLITDYLREKGVKTLDYVIGTHPHEDHIGSLDKVIEAFDVKTLILPDKDYDSKTYRDVLTAADKKKVEIIRAVPKTTYRLSADAGFTIVAPCGDYGSDLNNWSVGIRITHGENKILMCGDAEAKAEADMLASGEELSADLLKVSHHGSNTSTTEAFLDTVNPKYAVIMCGKDNDYGHPHRETLEKLQKRHIKIMRTDELGTITAVSDGEDFVFGASGNR